MKTIWQEDDIEPGIVVTRHLQSGKGWYQPEMIGWTQIGDNNVYGLIDMRDGAFMKIGLKEHVAKTLTEGGYVMALKLYAAAESFPQGIENRLHLPVLLITKTS